ncbi:inner membrane-spanning protein YciB [Pseudooctadecabacter jejudonensis]|uniref:Intracellular septation protein A n=1 Tax=Pseudooctadecabacter jejudonensis TaxID=1391910 RepID=A0A1Y5SX52_9RHOB|nr:septation protein IspZ [Pseudooctadecabacter jejudonensis]SLN50851.1 intracellular septation protein A [Pseudooctadecabacter jejudonensis]
MKRPPSRGVIAALEFGPVFGYLLAYLIFRADTFQVGETEYGGFIAVTAAFIPIFLVANGAFWFLTQKIARIQVAATLLIAVFGGLGVWLNDPDLIKMKPTAIYLALAGLLGLGLLRGQSWLKYIMEDSIPLRKRGWMILTRRLTVVFVLSAAANEVVWRTQSESFWVLFETLVMPVLIVLFFLTQIGLFIDNISAKKGR